MITKNISNNGTLKNRKEKIKFIPRSTLLNEYIDNIEITNPRKLEPQSPIIIDAGNLLYLMNEIQLPAIIAENIAKFGS